MLRTLLVFILSGTLACGDDGGSEVDASTEPDAMPLPADAAVGVACPQAQQNYPGQLFAASAVDDGTSLVLTGALDERTPPDGLRITLDTGADQGTGSITLPSAGIDVQLCIDDGDGTCADALEAVSGTLRLDSVTSRLQGGLDRIVFADDPSAPTCSASVTQSSFDVAIDGPP